MLKHWEHFGAEEGFSWVSRNCGHKAIQAGHAIIIFFYSSMPQIKIYQCPRFIFIDFAHRLNALKISS